MKICILSTMHQPNDDRIYYKEVLSLLKKYHDISMVMQRGNNGYEEIDSRLEKVPLKPFTGLFGRFMAIFEAVFKVCRLKPDICHFHDYELIFAAPFIRLFGQTRLIYDVHEMFSDMMQLSDKVPNRLKPFLVPLVDIFEKLMARCCAQIITADEALSQKFLSIGIPTETVFNYPCLNLFHSDPIQLKELREKYKGRHPIIYQGTMSIDRGLLLMFDAMAKLRKSNPDVILVLVGNISPTLKKLVDQKIEGYCLHDKVDIIGWVAHKNIVDYLCVARIGLVPFLSVDKYKKNIAIKQFEYMACGLPVVGSDLPPIVHYVRHAGSGLIFSAGDAESLASSIKVILSDSKLWKKMSEAGKKVVNEEWNWDKMEARLLKTYETLEQR